MADPLYGNQVKIRVNIKLNINKKIYSNVNIESFIRKQAVKHISQG